MENTFMRVLNSMKDLRKKDANPEEAWAGYRIAVFRGTEEVMSGIPATNPSFLNESPKKDA